MIYKKIVVTTVLTWFSWVAIFATSYEEMKDFTNSDSTPTAEDMQILIGDLLDEKWKHNYCSSDLYDQVKGLRDLGDRRILSFVMVPASYPDQTSQKFFMATAADFINIHLNKWRQLENRGWHGPINEKLSLQLYFNDTVEYYEELLDAFRNNGIIPKLPIEVSNKIVESMVNKITDHIAGSVQSD